MNQPTLPSLEDCQRSASFSACGRYRWSLRRDWPGDPGPTITMIMLNPSWANTTMDDQTIRRCMSFARQWGFRTLLITNLYAFITPYPGVLFAQNDPVGHPRNDMELLEGLTSETVVCAWGARAEPYRVEHVRALFTIHAPDTPLWCLGRTKGGAPRHPLYLPSSQELGRFFW